MGSVQALTIVKWHQRRLRAGRGARRGAHWLAADLCKAWEESRRKNAHKRGRYTWPALGPRRPSSEGRGRVVRGWRDVDGQIVAAAADGGGGRRQRRGTGHARDLVRVRNRVRIRVSVSVALAMPVTSRLQGKK